MPAEVVIEHIQMLQRNSLGIVRLGRRTGIHYRYLSKVAAGYYKKITVTIAEAILAVTPDDGDLISSLGTLRRIHALARAGHTLRSLDARLGYQRSRCSKLIQRGGLIAREVAEEIRGLYEELDGQTGPSTLTTHRAVAAGWEPHDAWNADTIDDPDATPYSWDSLVSLDEDRETEIVAELFVAGKDVTLRTKAQTEAAFRQLHARGLSDSEIADYWGYGESWAHQRRARYGLATNRPQKRSRRGALALYLGRRLQTQRSKTGLRNDDPVTRADARTSIADLEIAYAAAGLPFPPAKTKLAEAPQPTVEAVDLSAYDEEAAA